MQLLVVLTTLAAVLVPHPDVGTWLPILRTDGLPRVWAAVITVVIAAFLTMGLLSISRMLAGIARGDTVSPGVVFHFRRFALCLLLAALAQLLLPLIAVLLISHLRHVGTVTLSIDAGDVLALLLAFVFYFVSRLLVEASRLDEDSRSII